MPRTFGQNTTGGAHTTHQKGLRNKTRKGVGSYALKGKAKHADRYTRPYLTGEYTQWKTYYRQEGESLSGSPRTLQAHNRTLRTSTRVDSSR